MTQEKTYLVMKVLDTGIFKREGSEKTLEEANIIAKRYAKMDGKHIYFVAEYLVE